VFFYNSIYNYLILIADIVNLLRYFLGTGRLVALKERRNGELCGIHGLFKEVGFWR